MLKIVFYFFNAIALIISIVDLEYFQFNNKRLTFDIIKIVNEGEGTVMQYAKDYWYLLVLLIVLIFIIEFFYRKTSRKEINFNENFWVQGLLFLSGMAILFIVFNGNSGFCIVSPVTAAKYSKVQKVPLVTNSPYTFLYSLRKNKLKEKNFFNENEIDRYINLKKQYHSIALIIMKM